MLDQDIDWTCIELFGGSPIVLVCFLNCPPSSEAERTFYDSSYKILREGHGKRLLFYRIMLLLRPLEFLSILRKFNFVQELVQVIISAMF